MKTVEERGVMFWGMRWMGERRPGEVRPFYLTEMLMDFQKDLKEINDAAETGKEQGDDQPKHPRVPHREDL